MAKSYSILFVSLSLLVLSSCGSFETISIDYMRPGEVSFPPQLRKVAIVNNTNEKVDNNLLSNVDSSPGKATDAPYSVHYAYGNPQIAIETMAEEIAAENYFDEVVICDSALRAKDMFNRQSILSQEEITQLTSELGVDIIISLEELKFKATKTITFIGDGYLGTVDMKVQPIIRVYIPQKSSPMATIAPTDSIFWESTGRNVGIALKSMTPVDQILKESASFAGTLPIKILLPYWAKGERSLYSGGSAVMRDAAIYVRENAWDKAFALWNKAYENTRSKRNRMKLASNIALYYEMQDSIATAEAWATKAQELAKKVDSINKWQQKSKTSLSEIPNYCYTTIYVNKLKLRNEELVKLKMQMNRFNDDF